MSNLDKYPFASPSTEYAVNFKQFPGGVKDIQNKTEVSNHDLLMAMLGAADGIFHELRAIRLELEKR